MTPIAPLLALAVAAATPTPQPSGLRATVDRVAATVNGDVITLRELERTAGSALVEASALAPGPERDQARGQALRAALDLLVAEGQPLEPPRRRLRDGVLTVPWSAVAPTS